MPRHRSLLLRNHMEPLDRHIVLERLPPYALERNPVEHLFGYAKQREMASRYLRVIIDVGRYASARLKAMQRPSRLTRAFCNKLSRHSDVIHLRKAQ